MADSNTELRLAELLDKADVTKKDYIARCKRELNECFINNNNSSVMLAWQVNMHGTFSLYILNVATCLCDVCSPILS